MRSRRLTVVDVFIFRIGAALGFALASYFASTAYARAADVEVYPLEASYKAACE
jgi:hypothetical protein